MRSAADRFVDILFAASVLSWAILGAHADGATLVRLVLVAFNLVVATLFLVRAPAVRKGSPRDMICVLPSLLVAAFAFKLAPAPADWPLAATMLFASGAFVAIVAAVNLGPDFAIFPAVRGMATRGPFQVIRHPMYLGEMLMVFACLAAGPGWPAALLLGALLPSVALRIRREEILLSSVSANYRAYSARVRWRLLPGLW